MRYQLRYPQQPPHGGMYVLEKPELGMVGFGTSFEMLETNVRKWRTANAVPTGLGFSEELECEVCRMYPQECDVTDTILPLQRRLTLDDVVAGTKVLVSFKAAGSPLVPQEEAIRRAKICSECKLCVTFPKPCNGICASLKEWVDKLTGGYSTPYDNDPRACSICHCFYSSHVRLPYKFLEKGLDEEQKAQFQEAHKLFHCWKVEGAM